MGLRHAQWELRVVALLTFQHEVTSKSLVDDEESVIGQSIRDGLVFRDERMSWLGICFDSLRQDVELKRN